MAEEAMLSNWALGVGGSAIAALLSFFHVRITGIETRASAANTEAKEEARRGDAAIWDAMTKSNQDANTHRVEMASKMATREDVAALRLSVEKLGTTIVRALAGERGGEE